MLSHQERHGALGMRRIAAPTMLGAVALLAAIVLLVGAFVSVIPQVTEWPGPFVDWRTYEAAAARLMDGRSIYSPAQLRGPYHLTEVVLTGYAYPPASVPLLIPFQGYPLGLAAWITVNLGLLLTSIWAIVSRAWPAYRLLAFAIAVAGLSTFTPFLAGMIAASTNIGLAGAIGWVSVGLGSQRAGILGASLGVVKVFVGVIAAATTGDKARALGIAVLVAGFLAAVTLPIVGPGAWGDFATALTGAVPDCSDLNHSIACIVGPTVGYGWGSIAGLLVGGIATLGLLVSRQPYVMAVLAAVAVMAPASNLHIHYWVIAFVLVIATLARITELRRHRSAPTSFGG